MRVTSRVCVLTVAMLAALAPAGAQTRVLMSAVEARSGRPIRDLQAAQIAITDERAPRAVQDLAASKETVDVMLLVDSGLAGPLVRDLAFDLIDQLTEPEAMAVVGFDDTAQLIQDFTSSHPLLRESVSKLRYGNQPRVLDALAAAIGDGFEHATYRRVVLLLTAGYETRSVTTERDVIKLAQRHRVSVFPIYLSGQMRGTYESLARQTGGAVFNLMSMAKDATPMSPKPAQLIFEAVRNPYIATLSGEAGLSEKAKLEAKRPGKVFLSALPLH